MDLFREISTTADTGLQIFGKNHAELLKNSLKGLNHILFGKESVPAKKVSQYKFTYRADSFENLIVNFLSEILYLTYSKAKVAVKIQIFDITDRFLDSELHISDTQFTPKLDIKSVTYHNLKIIEKNGIKSLKIIFDI